MGETSSDILKLASDFMQSRVLLTAAELDLFTLLGDVPLSAGDAAARTRADVRALGFLLDALAAMGFLVKERETYRTVPAVLPLLSSSHPGSVRPMVLHAAHLWGRWSRLTDIVAGGKSLPEEAERRKKETEAFIGAMHVVAGSMAAEIAKDVAPGLSKALLDVGGASGTYTIAFLQAVPEMKATLFDRPGVVEMARKRIAEAGLLDRVTLVAGDFSRDELPGGHDLALLSAIIHQNSPEENRRLFGKVYRALAGGGRIIIRDHVMEPDRTRPKDGALFAINMLVGTEGGGTYTFGEIESWLEAAGFTGIRLLRKGERMDALVEAFKP
ncbi:MAG TPA: methyltransferase [Syntrophales bacterium]|nr:methyltransferase [Syntrophales bacterium]